jgi:membrane-associated phospholipid phosphatase
MDGALPNETEAGSLDVMALDVLPLDRVRNPRKPTQVETLAELTMGVILVGIAAMAGLVFLHRPWANRLDVWGDRLFPTDLSSRWAHDFATLGSMKFLIAGVVLVFLIGMLRDRVRAVACAIAPIFAVLIVQEIAKPLVDRHNVLSTGLSYPSGTVTAVAALATALTLVMPPKARFPMAVVGLLVIAGTGAAVVVLRWHYPTDALGGAAVGAGSVLLVDALMHIPGSIAEMIGSPPRGNPAGKGSATASRQSWCT